MNMNRLVVFGVAMGAPLLALAQQQRAAINPGMDRERGRCTIEVNVDGVAEIEVRGDGANLRTLSGAPAQWRRFECTSPMPPNPPNFHFSGVDGRGRQSLVHDPRDGGPVIVRIEDPQGGADRYKFDLIWAAGGRPPFESERGGGLRPFGSDDAMRVCQDAVRQQAMDRFRTREVAIDRIAMDGGPDRRDFVSGLITVRRPDGRNEPYRFSCALDFEGRRVRSVQIDPVDRDRDGPRSGNDRAIQGCQRSVEARLRQDGFDRVEIRSIRVDDQPGRNDWVIGSVNATRRDEGESSFEFSCNVDLRAGDVRSVDVRRAGSRR